MATDIRTTASSTFKADAARKNKVDAGITVPIAECDTKVCAAWANDIDEKLEQVNEVFVDGAAIPTLKVGDGTGSPTLTLDKSGAGQTAVALSEAGAGKWELRHTSGGDLEVVRDPGGGFTSVLTADMSAGDLTAAGGVSATKLEVRNGANVADVALVTATPEGAVDAAQGSVRVTTSGEVYVKTTAAGLNTGWKELATESGTDLAAVLTAGSTTGGTDITVSDGDKVLPASDSGADLGASGTRFANMFAAVMDATAARLGGVTYVAGAEEATVALGTGSPEGSVTANPGAVRLSTTGRLYLKASGTGNTGWVELRKTSESPSLASVLTAGSTTGASDMTVADGQKIAPQTTGNADLGSSSLRFGTVYSDDQDISGTATMNATKLVNGGNDATVALVTSTPEGNVAANPGSIRVVTDGRMFVKASGTGTTGWKEVDVDVADPTLADVLSSGNTTGSSDLLISNGQSVKPASGATCDLGSSSDPFADVYCGSIDAQNNITVAGVGAVIELGAGSGSPELQIKAGSSSTAGIDFNHGGSLRWNVRSSGSTGDLEYRRYNSGGSYQDTPLKIDGDDGGVRGKMLAYSYHNFYNSSGETTVYVPWNSITESTAVNYYRAAPAIFDGRLVSIRTRSDVNNGYFGVALFTMPDNDTTPAASGGWNYTSGYADTDTYFAMSSSATFNAGDLIGVMVYVQSGYSIGSMSMVCCWEFEQS